jgi:hypothetical protein
METPMRNSIPVPTLSIRAIVLGIVTVVVLMGITHHSFANVDPQAPYSSAGANEIIANADPLSPPG